MVTRAQKHKVLKEKDEEEIVRLREDGCTINEIANTVGCCDNKVMKVLKAKNVHDPNTFTKEQIRRVIELRNEGRTYSAIAYIMQCSKEKARYIYNKYILNY